MISDFKLQIADYCPQKAWAVRTKAVRTNGACAQTTCAAIGGGGKIENGAGGC